MFFCSGKFFTPLPYKMRRLRKRENFVVLVRDVYVRGKSSNLRVLGGPKYKSDAVVMFLRVRVWLEVLGRDPAAIPR